MNTPNFRNEYLNKIKSIEGPGRYQFKLVEREQLTLPDLMP